MKTKLIQCKVAGVTFEGRQETVAQLHAGDWYRIVPEPNNSYDPNALAVFVALNGAVKQIGYVPTHPCLATPFPDVPPLIEQIAQKSVAAVGDHFRVDTVLLIHSKATWIEMKRRRPDLFARAVEVERICNEKRLDIGRDGVFLHSSLKALEDAVPDQLPLFADDPEEGCADGGYCMV